MDLHIRALHSTPWAELNARLPPVAPLSGSIPANEEASICYHLCPGLNMPSLAGLLYFARVYPCISQFPTPHKMLEFAELTRCSMHRGQRVLDLGCGSGRATQLLARRGLCVVGVDPSESAVRNARLDLKRSLVRGRVRYECGTLESLRLPPESFDHVFSFCVLEHIVNLDVVLCEVARVLRPEGMLHATVDALSTITESELLARHAQLFGVRRYFRADSILDCVKGAGLEQIEQRYILAGEGARTEILDSIMGRERRLDPVRKALGFLRLIRQERVLSPPAGGLMLLVRAVRPRGRSAPPLAG